MEGQVYLLYEADAWLSYDSMVLMGVFDSDEALMGAVSELVRDKVANQGVTFKDVDSDDEEEETLDEITERIVDEFFNNNLQTHGNYEVNLYATTAELNRLEEDGIR